MPNAPTDSVEAMLAGLSQPSADRDYRPGHARMHALLEGLPLRRPRLRIRIAGTNGKGSTAWMLAAGLRAAGLHVGLYTSPHILRFNERIRIDGRQIDDAALLTELARIAPRALDCGASWFEAATALALACFSAARVDAEILEAGVGARLDATTAVEADMALITPIGLDHQAWLGETLTEIAREKSHAMDGCRFALGAPQPAAVRRVLQAHRPDMIFVDDPWRSALTMTGEHQRTNAALAIAALRTLRAAGQLHADDRTVIRAVERTRAPGRLQCVRWRGRRIWLDGAHNAHALEALLPTLPTLARPLGAIFVFTREDRDLTAALASLRPHARRIIAAAGDCDAAYACLEDALDAELAPPETGGGKKTCLILGSFTTVAAALRWLGVENTP